MNPILKKELRTLLREKNGWLVPVVYGALLAVVVFLSGIPSLERGAPSAETGRTFAAIVAVVQGIAVVIFAPLIGSSGIAGERERGTWTRLLATPIPRRQIASGKLFAQVLYVGLLLVVSLPFSVLAFLLGGADFTVILGLYTTHVVLAVTMVALGLAMSTVFTRTRTAALVSIGLSAGLCVLTMSIYGALRSIEPHVQPDPYQWILYFNPGYGHYLFFAADEMRLSAATWWSHYAALLSICGASVFMLYRRLSDLRD